MALFSKTTKKKVAKKATTKAVATKVAGAIVAEGLSWVLVGPRITEKATDVSERGVYVFDVATAANKMQIAKAISQVYKVQPVKVRTVQVRGKTVRNARTGMTGKRVSGKKAYVYLKKGDTLSIM
ncbi:MAG: 50S ribosomal protein L23 [Candidatus Pacebacteria bacterium]|nr:50S ribosomal protein L23 [Candidatus Paceibacterota bacterium]